MTEQYRNTLPIGHRLHEYRIEQILGAGGFGVTYLAYDENLHHQVAIKEYMPNDLAVREGTTVHAKSSGDEEPFRWGLDRFVQEAQTLARFNHANIVRVLRFFEENNTAYVVMDYEEGDSLKNILAWRKSRLDEDALKAILLPLLDGLEEVHGSGMIHRDIAPDNIYIRRKDESPVLLDFGAARQAVGGKSKSLSVVVKDGYAPAEQYETHGNQGPWTDIYALGAVVYRAISGEVPAESPARSNALLRRKPDPLQPAVDVGRGQYSEPFLLAVDHALAVIETDRPQNVVDWRGEMIGTHYPVPTLSPKSPPAPKAPAPEPKPSSPTDKRKIFWIVGGLLLLAGGGYFAEQVRETARQEEVRQAREARKADEARQAKAEAERKAQAKAEAEKQAQGKMEAERQAQAKLEAERLAQAKAEAEKQAQGRMEAERQAQAKLEAERQAAPVSQEAVQYSFGANNYKTYKNNRFGFQLEYPSPLLSQGRAPDNDDGLVFVSSDKSISLIASGMHNVLHESVNIYYHDTLDDHAHKGDEVVYKMQRENWFVVSGYSGNTVFYRKSIVSTDVIVSVRLSYKKELKGMFDRHVGRIASSLKIIK